LSSVYGTALEEKVMDILKTPKVKYSDELTYNIDYINSAKKAGVDKQKLKLIIEN